MVHELLLRIWDAKQDSMILSVLESSKISFNPLGGIVNSFDHGRYLVNMLLMILLQGISLSEIVQQVTEHKMGRELVADMETFKHVLAKPG